MARTDTQYNTVKMDDGRTVDFAGKRKMLKSTTISADGLIVTRLDFVNGETRTFTIPAALVNRFAAHGAEQKLGDEIAGLADVEDSIMAIDELTERLAAGNWAIARESAGMAGSSILARALAEHSKKDLAVIKTFLATKTQSEKVALRQNPAIAPIVLRLEAEKGAKTSNKPKVDTDSLLDELGTDVAVETKAKK
jgi:hypothetical protein